MPPHEDPDAGMYGTQLARNDILYLSTDLFTAVPTPGSSSSPAFATSR